MGDRRPRALRCGLAQEPGEACAAQRDRALRLLERGIGGTGIKRPAYLYRLPSACRHQLMVHPARGGRGHDLAGIDLAHQAARRRAVVKKGLAGGLFPQLRSLGEQALVRARKMFARLVLPIVRRQGHTVRIVDFVGRLAADLALRDREQRLAAEIDRVLPRSQPQVGQGLVCQQLGQEGQLVQPLVKVIGPPQGVAGRAVLALKPQCAPLCAPGRRFPSCLLACPKDVQRLADD